MKFSDLVKKTRSYRKFKQQYFSEETLRELVNNARNSASGANLQPLKYLISYTKETNTKIFPSVMWAAYYKDWKGPVIDERPTAYIVVLLDKTISKNAGCDHGIAAQTIVLGARDKGIGSCILGSIKLKQLGNELELSDRYAILLVIALGVPAETVVLEHVGTDGEIKYYRDDASIHHVPKRKLDDIIL